MTAPADEPDPQDHPREAAKLAAARVLHTLQRVQQGTAPPRALQRQITPQALEAYDLHRRPPMDRIERIRMDVITDRLAHLSAVARTSEGHVDAIVMELRRDGTTLPWQVTQLTTAADRQLVAYTSDDVSDRRTQRLPDDLTSKLKAARRERDHARQQVDTYRQRARQGPQATRSANGRLRQRWQAHVTQLDQEIQDLDETRRARHVRHAAQHGDPIASPRIRQLEGHLGPVPADETARRSWRHAAHALQNYADQWTDGKLTTALDTPAADPQQEIARQHLRRLVDNHLDQHGIDRTQLGTDMPTRRARPKTDRSLTAG